MRVLCHIFQAQRPPHLLPPPYLVDIDGHAHPLKGQSGILELIRPPPNVSHSKKEVVDDFVDYDEFMKRRQVQLACEKKQLTTAIVDYLSRNDVHQNNGDTLYDDQPCGSSSSNSQTFVQSQDSDQQADNKINIDSLSNSEVHDAKDNPEIKNGDVQASRTARDDFKVDAIVNGHPVGDDKQETTAVDHQNRNHDQNLGFDQKEQTSDQAVINDHASVNGDVISQQQVNDQAAINNQAVNNNQHSGMINDNDEINIIEFDNSDESGGGANNNMVTSIVWSCGLSDQEAKTAVRLWLSRAVIPNMDSDLYR